MIHSSFFLTMSYFAAGLGTNATGDCSDVPTAEKCAKYHIEIPVNHPIWAMIWGSFGKSFDSFLFIHTKLIHNNMYITYGGYSIVIIFLDKPEPWQALGLRNLALLLGLNRLGNCSASRHVCYFMHYIFYSPCRTH